MGARRFLQVGPEGATAFGLTPTERFARQAARFGLSPAAEPGEGELIVRRDHLYGGRLLRALVAAPPGTLLTDENGHIVAARADRESHGWALPLVAAAASADAAPPRARLVTRRTLAEHYDLKLRKKGLPLLMAARDPAMLERTLFRAAYKGVTDIVTRYLWPPIALPLTRWCAARGISPNQVTLVDAGLMLLALWLFWQGHFGLGLVAAWGMTLLDTVDGKLARVTIRSSKFGNILDHGIDLIHPPFWYWAWAAGLAHRGMALDDGGLTLALIIGGYLLLRLQEGLFIALFGMEIHVWRRFDSVFRLITARRNPNLIILTAATLAGAPRTGLMAVAAWTAVSAAVHLVRILQAAAARQAGGLRSWLVDT